MCVVALYVDLASRPLYGTVRAGIELYMCRIQSRSEGFTRMIA
jgi:hypothetical protein